jgi:8-oxo-dGTP pyrophosphatase MutT (NUDIX family)
MVLADDHVPRMTTLDHVRRALNLPAFDVDAARLRMAPLGRPIRREGVSGKPRLSAVLCLLYPVNDALHFVLIRRNEYKGVHSGQISFPGGKHEDSESYEQTALREACEEIGVCGDVTVIGRLTELYVPPSDFLIHPIVGYTPSMPEWMIDPYEVAEVIDVPLDSLLDDAIKGSGERVLTMTGLTANVSYYRVGSQLQHQVWGATAIILAELEGRLRAVI